MTTSEFPERIAFLGNYLPRLCGIATFTHDLCEGVSALVPSMQCCVGAINDKAEGYSYPPRVGFEIQESDLESYRRAAEYVNFTNTDLLCVQHEFGIYGGRAGSHLLAFLKEVRMPVVTTLHTILHKPDAAQRAVMEELIMRSHRLVVMAHKGAEILRNTYLVPDSKIDIIPHGIPDIPLAPSHLSKAQFGVEGRKVLLTFGLLGPGKGIEYVIEALPQIVRKHPDVVYLVLGATHPHLVAREGERYRLSLERLADERGVKEHLIFYNRFVSLQDLTEFIRATDVYVTPYLDEEQITSGTLAYVFGAGKAVVSTPYWHAQELLADKRGILVPFRSPEGIADGVCAFLDDPKLMERVRQEAHLMGRDMIWPAVAKRYLESFQRACTERKTIARASFAECTLANRPHKLPALRLDHIFAMSDDTGIFQHAIVNVPDFNHGYCTDDNARAYILCNMLDEPGEKDSGRKLNGLASRYLSFLVAALNRDTGRFRNFMSHNRKWLEDVGSEDAHGRALWAAGVGAARSRNTGHRKLSANLFERGLPAVVSFTSPRAWAFTLLGLNEYVREFPSRMDVITIREILVDKLLALWHDSAIDDWLWFEQSVTYDNARFCQAMLASGLGMKHAEAVDVGLKSLCWLKRLQTTRAGHFRPVGSNGFFVRGGSRAEFDQQPVEAHAMVSACLEAFRATQDNIWMVEARRAFEWFLGRNDLGLSLYDSSTGGCCDGLHSDRLNENHGAESLLAFQLSLAEMRQAEHPLVLSL